MDADELILTRRSIGKVHPGAVAEEVIRDLLRVAVHAPNHHMHQPWRFVVLQGEAREQAGRAHAAAVRRRQPDVSATADAREAARFCRAPVVIVCVSVPPGEDPVTRRESRDAVAAATQNLLLGAHARGLGAMWRTGTMADEPEVRVALGLRAHEEIVAFVYVGTPAIDPPARSRRPIDEVTEWRGTPPMD